MSSELRGSLSVYQYSVQHSSFVMWEMFFFSVIIGLCFTSWLVWFFSFLLLLMTLGTIVGLLIGYLVTCLIMSIVYNVLFAASGSFDFSLTFSIWAGVLSWNAHHLGNIYYRDLIHAQWW